MERTGGGGGALECGGWQAGNAVKGNWLGKKTVGWEGVWDQDGVAVSWEGGVVVNRN